MSLSFLHEVSRLSRKPRSHTVDLFPLSVSGGGGVYPGLRLRRGRLAGLPNVPVHQGALRSSQLRSVVCQSPAAYRTVLPQPWCVCVHIHVYISHPHVCIRLKVCV